MNRKSETVKKAAPARSIPAAETPEQTTTPAASEAAPVNNHPRFYAIETEKAK